MIVVDPDQIVWLIALKLACLIPIIDYGLLHLDPCDQL